MEIENEDDSLEEQPNSQSQDSPVVGCIGGMESVVATVSGYHGSERFNLIKLISQTGANYVGVMSRSITHLVCWKLEGEKFNLAKKFKIFIVSHRWFEDCVKAGRRVSEDPYRFQSGEEIGPLRLDGLLHSNKAGILSKKPHKVLLDLTNGGDDFEEPFINPNGRGSSRRNLSGSCLLDENLFPNSSPKSKIKASKKHGKEKEWSPSPVRYCQKPSLSMSSRLEAELLSHSTTRSVRQRLDTCNAVECATLPETSSKSRRLVQKKINRFTQLHVLSDSVEVCDESEPHTPQAYIQDTHEANASEGLNLSSNELSPITEENSHKGCSNTEKGLCDESKVGNQTENTRLPSSTKLSCVICWTDFSSTRGGLPCGHRFCYSCIQEWADHMASTRKTSTCPLCKAPFVSITKFDEEDTSEQKIYSQTIPYDASTTDIPIFHYRENSSLRSQFPVALVCIECQGREPAELLISCNVCHSLSIHTYCLDPPLLPWTCIYCKDRRTHYSWMQ